MHVFVPLSTELALIYVDRDLDIYEMTEGIVEVIMGFV